MKKLIVLLLLLFLWGCIEENNNEDLVPPMIPIVSGVEQNGYYEKEIKITVEKELGVTYEFFINNLVYKEGESYKNDGVNKLRVIAKKNSNNLIATKELSFTMNTSTPKLPKLHGVSHLGIYPTGLSITFDEVKGQKTELFLNNTPYIKGDLITSEGDYTLEVISTNIKNKKVAKKTINFTLINANFPVPEVVGVVDGHTYNKAVKIDISNRVEGIVYILYINDKEYPFNTNFNSQGLNKLVITGTNRLGKKLSTNLQFTQDFTGPSTPIIKGVEDGEYYKNARITFDKDLDTIYNITLNGLTYTQNTLIDIEGEYEVRVEAIKNGKNVVKKKNFFISKKDFIIKGVFNNEDLIAIFTNKDANTIRTLDEDRIVISSDSNTTNTFNKESFGENYIDFRPEFQVEPYEETDILFNVESQNTSPSAIGDKKKFNVLSMNIETRKNTNKLIDFELVALNKDSAENRQVNIWVAATEKSRLTNEKSKYLADKFLKDGTKEDIYAWLTNIFGKEWVGKGEKTSDYMHIDGNGEIDILLYKINEVASNKGRYLGYFFSKDNYKSNYSKDSNERIMFYLDLETYLLESGRDTIVSTLGHEFYHMINFYQKNVLRTNGRSINSWLNEMLALVSEDLLAEKLGIAGPRGVVGVNNVANITYGGRLPTLNQYNTFDVNDSDGHFEGIDYSIAYAYGAYLLRNYANNDLTFLRDIVHNDKLSFDSIEYALTKHGYSHKTFESTIKDWGIASMISDSSYYGSEKYYYNRKVTPKLNSIQYPLGAINLFNYYIKPTLYGTNQTNSPILSGGANIYYNLGQNLIGYREFSGNLPEGIDITLILKDNLGTFDESKSESLEKSIIYVK